LRAETVPAKGATTRSKLWSTCSRFKSASANSRLAFEASSASFACVNAACLSSICCCVTAPDCVIPA
jgi:hypothetical protein